MSQNNISSGFFCLLSLPIIYPLCWILSQLYDRHISVCVQQENEQNCMAFLLLKHVDAKTGRAMSLTKKCSNFVHVRTNKSANS